MKHRRVVFALLLGAPAAAIAVACSFPDVEFSDNPDGSIGTADGPNGSETSTSGGPTGDSSTDKDVSAPIYDGSMVDVDTRDAATVDAMGCATQPTCDCDNDGYRAADCGVDAALTDASLKAGDCDDLNPARNPGAGPRPDLTDNGDWNCDGVVTKTPPGNMPSNCPGSGLTCTGSFGFLNDPACGTSVTDEYQCKSGTLGGAGGLLSCGSPQPVSPETKPIVNCQ